MILLLAAYLAITTAGIALFMKIALPPVHAQSEELGRTLAQLREAAVRNAQSLGALVEDLTAGVDEALPGLADGAVDNWSSTRTRRRVRLTGTGPMGVIDAR